MKVVFSILALAFVAVFIAYFCWIGWQNFQTDLEEWREDREIARMERRREEWRRKR